MMIFGLAIFFFVVNLQLECLSTKILIEVTPWYVLLFVGNVSLYIAGPSSAWQHWYHNAIPRLAMQHRIQIQGQLTWFYFLFFICLDLWPFVRVGLLCDVDILRYHVNTRMGDGFSFTNQLAGCFGLCFPACNPTWNIRNFPSKNCTCNLQHDGIIKWPLWSSNKNQFRTPLPLFSST